MSTAAPSNPSSLYLDSEQPYGKPKIPKFQNQETVASSSSSSPISIDHQYVIGLDHKVIPGWGSLGQVRWSSS
ncbi:hypothetical protein Pyn_23296 [Prunus yedoensis var. nudiflora]|uniref:Uncharacterized protein n=1 Tax=Prunus yedoensis var. nudiflora TaxID=2094558 RepID=A0A314UXN8_PRUYE|nr:hypothetical protein Pyn_23296 [Prunus yedoensis var. nudiflora]